MKILVSACLMGDNCKYNGGNNYCQEVVDYLKDKEYVKVCPECLGGLSIPRLPSEIKGNKVLTLEGIDVTKNYFNGANKVLKMALKNKIKVAILKSNSPSCGNGRIYDGSFTKKLILGDGITTQLLKSYGITVINSDDLKK